MTVTPKSLVLDLLSTTPGHSLPVATLLTAGQLFRVSENNMRVTLARLRGTNLIGQDRPGHYHLNLEAAPVGRHVVGWRAIEDRVTDWHGGWIGVHTASVQRSERRAHRHANRALHFLGFKSFSVGLHLRPDNLTGGVDAIRTQLHSLGLHSGSLVFAIRDLDRDAEQRARRLWDTASIRRGYRSSLAKLQKSERQLGRISPAQALVESFVVGGEILRQIVLDPLLPSPLIPTEERRALIEAMRRYDTVGRACWKSFLQETAGESTFQRINGRKGEAA